MLIGYDDIYSKAIIELKGLIAKGITGKHKKIGNVIVRSQYGKIVLDKSIGRPTVKTKIRLTKQGVTWGNWKLKYTGTQTIYARSWKSGDRFEPSGMKGGKKLQDFFVDRKIPKSERTLIPIIVDKNDKVLSVSNFRVAKNAVNLKKCLQINRIK
jgi:tRNA(Ile)-lysidine synthetase-like protein